MFSRLLVGLCVVLSLICVVSAYDPRLCVDCMDGMPMPHCPSPSACGYAPVNCTICIPVKTPECKGDIAQDCSVYTCDKCMGGMWMPNCPDPGVCGKTPTPCVGCDVGNVTTCPDPDYCYYPGCVGCVDGQVTANCPDPSVCGYQPACDGCMAGMPMENCPNYDACVMAGADTCMMEMVFNTGHNACVLFSSWNISSGGQWFGTIVAIFFAAFLREFVAFYRSYKLMTRKRAKEAQKYTSVNNKEVRQSLLPASNGSSSNGTAASVSDSSSKPSPLPYAIDSLLYLAQHTLSYLLMLIIMTYNFYLFLAVVLSFAFWHFSIHYSYAAYFRAKLAPTQQISKNSSSKTTATKDIEEKTGGDHCCEDIDFDE